MRKRWILLKAKMEMIIIGAGGHAKVVAEAWKSKNESITGFYDDDSSSHGQTVLGLPIIGNSDEIKDLAPDNLLIGLGIGDNKIRCGYFDKFTSLGFSFPVIAHEDCSVSPTALISSGVVLFAQSVVNANARIAEAVIVNSGAIVEHDCDIGRGVHIAPGTALAGGVSIGEFSFIGMGSVVKEGIKIGRNCVIGAGSVILDDLPDNVVAFGVPAKIIKKLGRSE